MSDVNILVVEDDKTLLEIIKYNLTKEGYTVSIAVDGIKALEVLRESRPNIILLDVMLPGLNGFEVCRIVRKESNIPIIFLSARAEEIDKVVGLEIGADDYITKPFSMRELIARVRANIRRQEIIPSGATEDVIKINSGNLEVDVARRSAVINSKKLDLTVKEFDLLVFLIRNRGIVFNRDQLLEKVWGYNFGGDTRTVDVHIRWLRQKIEVTPDEPKRILTIRGVGYKLEE